MEVYERIKLRRKELGLSADDVADALGVSRATVYRYESASIEKLPTSIIQPLAQVLRCSSSYLMGWEENTPAVAPVLEDREQKLLSSFALLNDSGQEEALKRVEELTELPKYKK